MERLSSLGYMALKKETTKGTAVTPDDYVSLYDENLTTDISLVEQGPAVGTKAKVYSFLQGLRSHKGDFTVMAEPNTAAKIFDMLMTKGTTSGSAPYTHPFTISNTANPNSYTVDLSTGNQVFRFMGVEASEISPSFQENEMRLKAKISALKAFASAEISSITPGTPNTVVLKTLYDPAPTNGLVAGDLIRFTKAAGTTVDATIVAVTDGVTFTWTGTATGIAAGDLVTLRPATASYTQKTPFMWARTEFRFGVDATTALAATQTQLEKGSEYNLTHSFNDDGGESRSGSFDPASLARTTAEAGVKIKKFFDTPDQVNQFYAKKGQSLVVRHFSETGYELRVTINSLTYKVGGKPSIKAGSILLHEFDGQGTYSTADSQIFDVKVINNLATI